jgi:hypothetical protein
VEVLGGDFGGNGNMSGFCWGLGDMGVLGMRRRENRGKRLWGSGVERGEEVLMGWVIGTEDLLGRGDWDFCGICRFGFFSQSQKRLPNPGFWGGGVSVGFFYPLHPIKLDKMCILYSFSVHNLFTINS